MKITTKIVFDINGKVLTHEWFEYEGPIALLGRSDAGKRQEQAQVDKQNQQAETDRAARDKATNAANSSIDKLEANPGYTPQDIANDRSRNAAVIGGAYEGAEDQIAREAAATGHENDSGNLAGVKQLAASKVRAETGADMDFVRANADQSLQTRRMLPGLRFAPASVYAGSANNLAGVNSSLINGRMQADSVPTFAESLGLGLVQSAGQVGAAYAGRPPVPNTGCWIAMVLFGDNDRRTLVLRRWLNGKFQERWFGKQVMRVYLRHGEAIARVAKRSALLRLSLMPIFLLGLQRAEKELARSLTIEAFA